MRLGIMADIHGNDVALRAVLDDAADCRVHPGDLAHGTVDGLKAEHRMVSFDVEAVVRDLRARLHPNAEFLEAILTGKRQQYRNGR
jgi:hypothetical protein